MKVCVCAKTKKKVILKETATLFPTHGTNDWTIWLGSSRHCPMVFAWTDCSSGCDILLCGDRRLLAEVFNSQHACYIRDGTSKSFTAELQFYRQEMRFPTGLRTK
ncbi:hypothetical protein BaRGS_00038221 [Batillaria attramentaria]|uniref:LAGLIDADG homing endonuclease n=1 Tax=Batillaria attramentaria TaxID=370345 RepID=A0ABD0J6H1_9CAEN